MNNELTIEQVLDQLIIVVADCLALDINEVTPESTFFEDLGGESLDLIEIPFRMQRQMGLRGKLHDVRGLLEYDKEGRVSPATIERLEAEIPTIDWAVHLAGKADRDFFTIRLIAEILLQSHLKALISETLSIAVAPTSKL